MPTGQPLTLKCPRCRRGQHGRDAQKKGVKTLTETRLRKLYRGRRPGGKVTFQQAVLCLDCGHSWWTSLYDSFLKVRELLERQKQLRLPSTGPADPVQL